MNIHKTPFLVTSIVAMTLPALAAEDLVAKELEKKAIGYWAADAEAMLKVFTEEKGMKREDAAGMIAEASKLTIHVEKGTVHLYTPQGIVSTAYQIEAADKATSSLTLRAAIGPDAPKAQAVQVNVNGDQITVMGGAAPFVLKRIDEAEFQKRRKAMPADKVGP
jgi:hypothetical protein